MQQELYKAQQKLQSIDKLTNCIKKISDKYIKDEIAYLIHEICNADDISSSIALDIQHFQLLANKDLFVKI